MRFFLTLLKIIDTKMPENTPTEARQRARGWCQDCCCAKDGHHGVLPKPTRTAARWSPARAAAVLTAPARGGRGGGPQEHTHSNGQESVCASVRPPPRPPLAGAVNRGRHGAWRTTSLLSSLGWGSTPFAPILCTGQQPAASRSLVCFRRSASPASLYL